jgi:WD40 repeat protein
VNSGDMLLRLNVAAIADVWWNTDESRLLTRSKSGEISLWDATQRGELSEPLSQRSDGNHPQSYLRRWETNGERLALWDDYNSVQVWDMNTGELLTSVTTMPRVQSSSQFSGGIGGVAFNADGSRFITFTNDNTEPRDQFWIQIWDASTGEELLRLSEDLFIRMAMWTPDGSKIVSLTPTGGHLWDANTGEHLITFPQMQVMGPMSEAVWSPDGERFLIGLYELQMAYLSGEQAGQVETLPLPIVPGSEIVKGAVWNEDGTRILYWTRPNSGCRGTCNSALGIYNLTSGTHDLYTTSWWYEGAAWNADESRVLAWSWDGIDVWDASP